LLRHNEQSALSFASQMSRWLPLEVMTAFQPAAGNIRLLMLTMAPVGISKWRFA